MSTVPLDPRSVSWITKAEQEISSGSAVLGIELGSTRIKACLVLSDGTPAATGSHEWENTLVDGHWSYSLEDVWAGLQACYADLGHNVERSFGVQLRKLRGIGISAMMHGYLVFDEDDQQLVPFRTWRDTYTGEASAELTDLLDINIPLRWSIAHYYQSVLDKAEHIPNVDFFTTLAGYVHWKLTGRKVLGVGDAAGMFPIDPATNNYDASRLQLFDERAATHGVIRPVKELLPEVLVAGQDAGGLSVEGARLLDPTGKLLPGVPLCPPEGDAGTGMVATNAVRPRTGNVSVGTSIFAMIVTTDAIKNHPEVDPVTTPDGLPVAMVHCNNGAQEVSAWIRLFSEVAVAFGKFKITNMDDVYAAILTESLHADDDAGGLLAYNYLSGEPITGLEAGRPMLVRTPDANLNLANFIRAQLYSAFATLSLGMKILAADGVEVEELYAHGGLFRTAGVAQRMLAAALNTPVGVADSAAEGGAWGIALLALYLQESSRSLPEFLDQEIFADSEVTMKQPEPKDLAGFNAYLERFEAALPIQHSAVTHLPLH